MNLTKAGGCGASWGGRVRSTLGYFSVRSGSRRFASVRVVFNGFCRVWPFHSWFDAPLLVRALAFARRLPNRCRGKRVSFVSSAHCRLASPVDPKPSSPEPATAACADELHPRSAAPACARCCPSPSSRSLGSPSPEPAASSRADEGFTDVAPLQARAPGRWLWWCCCVVRGSLASPSVQPGHRAPFLVFRSSLLRLPAFLGHSCEVKPAALGGR